MIKTTISEAAQSDAKLQFIKDFNLAFATCDTEYILSCFADDASWEMVGGPSWNTKDEIEQTLKTMNDGDAAELVIHSIVSRDNQCASSGLLKYDNGRDVAYCDVYQFSDDGTKIKTLTAYAIELESQ